MIVNRVVFCDFLYSLPCRLLPIVSCSWHRLPLISRVCVCVCVLYCVVLYPSAVQLAAPPHPLRRLNNNPHTPAARVFPHIDMAHRSFRTYIPHECLSRTHRFKRIGAPNGKWSVPNTAPPQKVGREGGGETPDASSVCIVWHRGRATKATCPHGGYLYGSQHQSRLGALHMGNGNDVEKTMRIQPPHRIFNK